MTFRELLGFLLVLELLWRVLRPPGNDEPLFMALHAGEPLGELELALLQVWADADA